MIGRLEFADRWFADQWNVDELIDNADALHGLRFVRLEVIRATKARLRRPRTWSTSRRWTKKSGKVEDADPWGWIGVLISKAYVL